MAVSRQVANQSARLVYLVSEFQIDIPAGVAKYLPGGAWIRQIGKEGPGSADVDIRKVQQMIEMGRELGKGSEQEAVALIKTLVHDNVRNGSGGDLTPDQVSKVYQQLDRMSNIGMYEEVTLDLDEIDLEEEYLDYFKVGFEPFDVANHRGFVPSLVLLIGRTGTGKTRICLAIAEAGKKAGAWKNVLFIANEFSREMLIDTIQPQLRRRAFSKQAGDLFRPGSGWVAKDILEYLRANPEIAKDMAVFYDSPDVNASHYQGDRRFFLEAEYRTLSKCREHCKILFVTSQAKRGIQRVTIEAVTESWGKTHYSDVIIPINLIGSTVEIDVAKNRFGPTGGTCSFQFDYQQLVPFDVENEESIWAEFTEGNG